MTSILAQAEALQLSDSCIRIYTDVASDRDFLNEWSQFWGLGIQMTEEDFAAKSLDERVATIACAMHPTRKA